MRKSRLLHGARLQDVHSSAPEQHPGQSKNKKLHTLHSWINFSFWDVVLNASIIEWGYFWTHSWCICTKKQLWTPSLQDTLAAFCFLLCSQSNTLMTHNSLNSVQCVCVCVCTHLNWNNNKVIRCPILSTQIWRCLRRQQRITNPGCGQHPKTVFYFLPIWFISVLSG